MNFFDVSEKVVVITGGSSGIGFGLAQVFAKAGSKVVIVNRDKENSKKAVAFIKKKGGIAVSISADVVNKKEVKEMFKSVINIFGRIDIVINSAGILIRKNSLEMKEEEWDLQIDVNLKGTFNCSVEAAPYMINQRWGRIINIASKDAKFVGVHTTPAYAATKSGVIMMSKVLAIEYIPYNINVNVIAPGFFPTHMNEKFRRDNVKEIEKNILSIPRGSVGKVIEDLGGVAIFLASNACQHMVGQVIYIDGGSSVGVGRWGTKWGLPVWEMADNKSKNLAKPKSITDGI